jgi:hypothetical protein
MMGCVTNSRAFVTNVITINIWMKYDMDKVDIASKRSAYRLQHQTDEEINNERNKILYQDKGR